MKLPDQFIFGLTSTEYRPCYVTVSIKGKKEEHKAMFHKWTLEAEPMAEGNLRGSHPAGQFSTTLGIVELENGEVHRITPEAIRFLNTDSLIEQYAWDDLK